MNANNIISHSVPNMLSKNKPAMFCNCSLADVFRVRKCSIMIVLMALYRLTTLTLANDAPSRLLFGSCNSQNLTQPLWPVIMSRNGTAFVWGGDAIYADYSKGFDLSNFPSVMPRVHSATTETFELFYSQQLENQAYQNFINTGITIFGTLDDHDYGINNGDYTYPYAKDSALAFLNFTNEPKDSPMWLRARQGLGLYGVKVFDFDRPLGARLLSDEEAGLDPDITEYIGSTFNLTTNSIKSNKKVAVFVLDIRTNRTPWKHGVVADNEGDFLGARQWKWFEEALGRSDAAANIVVQGLPVHSHRHYDNSIAEDWEKFPVSRQRLYDLLLKDNVEAPILVSGDVHMAHLMRQDCFSKSRIRSLVEFTTSGMTHSWGNCFSPQIKFQNSTFTPLARFASWSFMSLSHALYDFTDVMFSKGFTSEVFVKEINTKYPLFGNGGGENAKIGLQFSLDLNFGELDFDWERRVVNLRILGKDLNAPPLLSANWTLDELSGRTSMPGTKTSFQYVTNSVSNDLFSFDGDWQCLPHRGRPNRIRWLLAQTVLFIYFSIIILSMAFAPAIVAIICLLFSGKYLWSQIMPRARVPKNKKLQ